MHNEFKNGNKVFVDGPGQNNGKYYHKKLAIIIARDPYYFDYHVRFKDGTEDWILSQYLRNPYTRKDKKK